MDTVFESSFNLKRFETMRELVVNNAVASQFVFQKWHDLPRQNRGQKFDLIQWKPF